jgi:prophage regulatory protein
MYVGGPFLLEQSMNKNFQVNGSSGDRLMRPKSVCEMLGISKATLWRWVKSDDSFPKPLKLTGKTTVWWSSEVHAWVNARTRG